ncbi:protein PAM68, chloroplastic-like [Phoenix dactylifera]|uniref:Protein PAM68, chloroplastic-like n=1 Tax=Phoenix dactylifera TaxID=42345 RepID=A0A8B8ZTV6_PHODC|nr:protein PAM68, chloroplastic-like [Phoenix dactylifera]
MESFAFLRIYPLAPLQTAPSSHSSPPLFPLLLRRHPPPLRRPTPPATAALKSPRGFGPAPQKTKKRLKRKSSPPNEDDDEEEEESENEGTIPEVVTNRMMRRMGFSVGIPLAFGLLFFPFFYYLKVVSKIDVPTWIPFLVSFFFFGSALLGVSYGIVSASWDPLREGSLLGWNEARRNWPVFWQSLWGGGKK